MWQKLLVIASLFLFWLLVVALLFVTSIPVKADELLPNMSGLLESWNDKSQSFLDDFDLLVDIQMSYSSSSQILIENLRQELATLESNLSLSTNLLESLSQDLMSLKELDKGKTIAILEQQAIIDRQNISLGNRLKIIITLAVILGLSLIGHVAWLGFKLNLIANK